MPFFMKCMCFCLAVHGTPLPMPNREIQELWHVLLVILCESVGHHTHPSGHHLAASHQGMQPFAPVPAVNYPMQGHLLYPMPAKHPDWATDFHVAGKDKATHGCQCALASPSDC